MQRTRPELRVENAWILHQDNVLLRTVFVTRKFLTKNNIITIPSLDPPYSLDLASYDFYLFSKVKNMMRDEYFVAVDIIKRETTKLLKKLTKEDMQHSAFRNGRSIRYTKSREEYSEGNHIPVTE